jgi:hypothetical protein
VVLAPLAISLVITMGLRYLGCPSNIWIPYTAQPYLDPSRNLGGLPEVSRQAARFRRSGCRRLVDGYAGASGFVNHSRMFCTATRTMGCELTVALCPGMKTATLPFP